MSYPYMTPHSIIFPIQSATNARLNIDMLPIFVAPNVLTITGMTLVAASAVNVEDAASEIRVNLVQLANATNVPARLTLNTVSNLVANAATEFTVNSTCATIAAGTVLGINLGVENEANMNFGLFACYQMDYVQGSPGAEAA